MAAGAALLVLLIALIVMTGWVANIAILNSSAPGRIELKLPTATAFLLLAVAILIQVRVPRLRRASFGNVVIN